jgi:hypothetical protein
VYQMDATAPSPLRWRDLVDCVEQFRQENLVVDVVEVLLGDHATKGIAITVHVRVTPSIGSPWYGARRQLSELVTEYVRPGFSLPLLIWRAYWRVNNKVHICWPVSSSSD